MSAPLLVADSRPLIALARLDLLASGYFLARPLVDRALASIGE